MTTRRNFGELVRSVTFGVEDSLVSTVGLLSGVASAGVDRKTIILSGMVLVVVEAISMAMGEITAIESEEEAITHKEIDIRKTLPSAGLMFVSYVIAGVVPLLPYIFLARQVAFPLSISLSVFGLFAYGYAYGVRMRLGGWLHGLRMMVLGGSAIAIGVGVGLLFR